MPPKRLVEIGRVTKVFGLKGEVKINPYTESFETFQRSGPFFFDDAELKVLRVRTHKGAVLAVVEGFETPEKAAALVGKLVMTPAENLPEKEEDEYYWHELIGMKVTTVQGRELGEITGVTPTGANDVLNVEGPLGEILLPMIEDVVKSVDTESNLMIVDPLEGLIPDA